jgi:glycosyltransferase involved in cell wall biosynthesis
MKNRRSLLTTLLLKARQKGLQESLELSGEIVRASASRVTDGGRRAFVFLSPPLYNSGAPQILMQVVDEFATRYGPESVRLLAPPVDTGRRERGEVSGVRVERAAKVLSPALVRLQLALREDDFVLMNTVAISRNYLNFVLDSLRTRRLAHAYWYIHEDVAQLPVLAPDLLEPNVQTSIGRLTTEGRLTILVPSKRVKSEYDRLFATDKTRLLPFKIDIDASRAMSRSSEDYSSVRFLMSGKPTDGRKGHMIALSAFHEFMKAHYECDPDGYRPFKLTLVGMSDDYVAEQIRSIGMTILGERFEPISTVSHERALEITQHCNAVICCSFNEALPLYVIEGMCAAHVVLRNDAGGAEEQLEDGVNGFRIDSTDVKQFASVLESVLNKVTMSDRRLQAMGRASQGLVDRLRIPSYVDALEQARNAAVTVWLRSGV